MRELAGSPGTWSGLSLRLGQFAFAAASVCVMASALGFANYTAFCYLIASMGLQALWSLGLACLDVYALKLKNDLHSAVLVSLFVVGDWMEKATWDAYHTKVFCEICKEETESKNRPLGCLDRKGYKNLEEKFFAITKKRLTRKQFKNKWDFMKKDYTQFMELKLAATGLGWDDQLGTIEADETWWHTHLEKYPKHAKWRYGGPANLKELDIMFAKAHVTGETAAIPGEISSSSDGDASVELKESDDVELTASSSKKGKTPRKRKTKSNVEEVEDKNPFLRAYKQTLGNINSRVSGEGSGNYAPKSTIFGMAEVLSAMLECGVAEGTPLFHTATKIMMKPDYRELFMLIKTNEGRFDWLQREHEEMKK